MEKLKRGCIQGLSKFFSGTRYYLRNGKSYGFQTWPVYSECSFEQKPIKILEKRERGRIQGLPNFWGTPYYLSNETSYGFQIWPVGLHSDGLSKQKPMKNFIEKGAWAYPGTARCFKVPPIISGTGKATDFKCGRYIHRAHLNKSLLIILQKREHRHIQGQPNVYKYLLLSLERVKLRTSNFVRTLIGSIRTKAH